MLTFSEKLAHVLRGFGSVIRLFPDEPSDFASGLARSRRGLAELSETFLRAAGSESDLSADEFDLDARIRSATFAKYQTLVDFAADPLVPAGLLADIPTAPTAPPADGLGGFVCPARIVPKVVGHGRP